VPKPTTAPAVVATAVAPPAAKPGQAVPKDHPAIAALYDAAKKEGKVSWWDQHDQAVAQKFVDAFQNKRVDALLLALVVAAAATFGDLAESLVKRDLELKDMGNVLPGHGGVLDRIDSLLFVAPAAFLLFRIVLG